MADQRHDEPYRPYRQAIRRRVCAVCLDSAADGSCRPSGVWTCPIDDHLPEVIQAVRDVREGRESSFEGAVKRRVCRGCGQRSADGACPPREDGRCALVAYLPLIVRAIEDVDGGHRGA